MSNLHKSKRYDLIDMFIDNPRYLDDIFTIDNPEFEKHIPVDLQLPYTPLPPGDFARVYFSESLYKMLQNEQC